MRHKAQNTQGIIYGRQNAPREELCCLIHNTLRTTVVYVHGGSAGILLLWALTTTHDILSKEGRCVLALTTLRSTSMSVTTTAGRAPSQACGHQTRTKQHLCCLWMPAVARKCAGLKEGCQQAAHATPAIHAESAFPLPPVLLTLYTPPYFLAMTSLQPVKPPAAMMDPKLPRIGLPGGPGRLRRRHHADRRGKACSVRGQTFTVHYSISFKHEMRRCDGDDARGLGEFRDMTTLEDLRAHSGAK